MLSRTAPCPSPGVTVRVINNARSETVYTKRSFKDAVVSHRCAIPVNGFIDWETDGEENKWPHYFTLPDERAFQRHLSRELARSR